MNYHIVTYGCQMNVHESEKIAGILREKGYEKQSPLEEADIVVFNTCCIRENAENHAFGNIGALKKLKKQKKHLIVAVGGCMAQEEGKAQLLREKFPFIDIVFGTHNLAKLGEYVERKKTNKKAVVEIVPEREGTEDGISPVRTSYPNAWVNIMYGCNNFCSYCIVPYVRGREKSRPLEDIAEEARRYGEAGVKEITLLGQNVNSYGRDLYGEPRFADVLDAVDASGVERLRFATSHPKDLTDEVIARFGTLRSLMPALHLPVQSGSNRILAAMNRRYTREHYLGLIEKLRAVVPDIALSTDIIVGFPGETEEDFMETYRLVEEVGYGQVFTFIYSKREGTPAAAMEDDTPREVIQERFDRLVDLVQRKAWEANQGELDTIVPVLIEGVSKRDELVLAGKSPKNQTVHAPVPAGLRPEDLIGTIVPVAIDEARTWYLSGTVVDA